MDFLMKSNKEITEENLRNILMASGNAQYVEKNSKKIALLGNKLVRETVDLWTLLHFKQTKYCSFVV